MMVRRCPLCRNHVDDLITTFSGENELSVVEKLHARHPEWDPVSGLCERCLYLNEYDTLHEHFESPAKGTLFRKRIGNDFALLPTPLRLNIDPRFTGSGITIAFIDAGFFPHPDLTTLVDRVLAFVDVTDERKPVRYFHQPHVESWHGTMTTVAACGNGNISEGLYRGIATRATIVAVKVMDTRLGRITSENIARGIRWTIENRERYNIRVVSVSVGGDAPGPLSENVVDRAVEEAVAVGMVVVTASGNVVGNPILPPASAPSAVTVGGLDDRNDLRDEMRGMYHSTYGRTPDGEMKPDLIAPAIWVAGAILPRTDQFRESEILFKLIKARPSEAARLLRRRALKGAPVKNSRRGNYKEWAIRRIIERQYVAPYFKHMDGTSLAAPFVSSVVAQMLEANPALAPGEVKDILTSTAEPLKGVSAVRQGNGVLNARGAVRKALDARLPATQPGVYIGHDAVVFVYHNRIPRAVALAGEFNQWSQTHHRLHEHDDGVWSCRLPKPARGTYRYKYVLDEAVWLEDPTNPDKEPDGYSGWNSTLTITG